MRSMVLAVLLCGVAACAAEEGAPSYGDGLGTPENPIPDEDSYAVATRVRLTIDDPAIADALANLRAFGVNPGRAVLAQAQAQQLPELQRLYADLSTTLEDRLEGWINVEIDKGRIAGKTARQFAADIAAITETSLTQFTIESSLSITPGGAMHSLTSLNFTPVDVDVVVPIGGLAADKLTQRPTATVGIGGALAIGEQRFGLGFGHHAWQAVNLASNRLYGADVRSALASGVRCETIAQIVSTKCVNGACVGHASELRAICEASTASLVDDFREYLPTIVLSEIRLVTGTARLDDHNGDGLADHILEGTWDAQLGANVGLRSTSATFTTTR